MKKYVVHRDIYVNSLIYLESVVPVPMIPQAEGRGFESRIPLFPPTLSLPDTCSRFGSKVEDISERHVKELIPSVGVHHRAIYALLCQRMYVVFSPS